MTQSHFRVAIIGSGFSGLGAAIQLKRNKIDDFVVIEKASGVGGTWQVNDYPGAQCDIPSVIYSFSFAPNPDWSRLYPLQAELKAYLETCAEDFKVTPHVRFNTEVLSADWDDDAQLWRLTTTGGDLTATVLIGAIGPFSAPNTPDLPGLSQFKGTVFHSQTWDHDHSLNGERVGVIGTGASAVQFIPQIQPQVAKLSVFQRTATWILPHPDRALHSPARAVFKYVPGVKAGSRIAMEAFQESLVPGFVYEPALQKGLEVMARRHIAKQVKDPALREKLTPAYAVGCKRPTFSNKYYPALTAANTDVVTDGIVEVTAHGIRTADGTEHALDTIIFGTGFKMSDHPGFHVVKGKDGKSIGDVWSGGDINAYLGITMHNFPNFFMMLGPNSAAYTSAVISIEAQLKYVIDGIKQLDQEGLSSIEVKAEVQQKFCDWVDHGLRNSVWNTGGCSSYYLSPSGRNFSFYPGFARQYKARTAKLRLADYDVVSASQGSKERVSS